MVWVEIMLSKKKTFYCNFILLEFFLQKWNLSISCQLDLFRIQSLYYRNVSIHSLSVVFAYLFWYAWGNCGHPTNYVRNCLSDGICFILFRKKNSRMWDPVSQHYGSKHHQDKTIPPNHRQIYSTAVSVLLHQSFFSYICFTAMVLPVPWPRRQSNILPSP